MRLIYFILGIISLIFAGIGIALPMLPATPFLFLTAFFFARSSKRLHEWIISTQAYRDTVLPIKEKRGITVRKKVKIVMMITLVCAISFYFMKNPIGRAVLVLVVLGHAWLFFFKIKTAEAEAA